MTDNSVKFDDLDRRALNAFDPGFVINDSCTSAVFNGEIQIEVARTARADGDQLLMTITFPTAPYEFRIRMLRSKTLQELEVEGSES